MIFGGGVEISRNATGWKGYLIVALLLAVIFIQTVSSLRLKSPTVDEIAHLPAGYSYLRTGDFRLGRENPSFIKLVAAVPLLFFDLRIPTDHPSWDQFEQYEFGKQFLYHYNRSADQIIFWGRVPIVLLSLLLGFFVFKWAKELYGIKAGLFALFLYAFEPNILAHSRLATTDLGITCFIFIAIYFFWRFLENSTKKNLLLAGLTFGLAQVSKFSAILLIPIYVTLIFFRVVSAREITSPIKSSLFPSLAKTGKEKIYILFVSLVLIFAVGFAVIFLSYGCQLKPLVSLDEPAGKHLKILSQRFPRDGQPVSRVIYFCLEKIPLPAGDWFRGFISQTLHAREGHSAFLMGMYSTSGWWYYHFIAFLVKTPIALLVLVALTIAFWRGIRSESVLDECFLLVPIAVVFFSSALGRISIGLRYILPIYPFLFVFVSKLVRVRVRKQTLFVLSLILLCSWYLFSSLSVYPHYLAYFNEFVGGPDNGYKYLVDSNLDWGQDLKGLAKYVRDKDIKEMKLSYFGMANPAYYDFSYKLMGDYEMHHRVPGIYAISATNLQNVLVEDKTRFAWLKKYEPIDKIGYSIFIYKVD